MSRKKARVQEALRDLRKRLNLTQQGLAEKLGIAVITASRWESSRPPSGLSLSQLVTFARDAGHQDIAAVFRSASDEETRPQGFFSLPLHPVDEAMRTLRAEMYFDEEAYWDANYEDEDEAEAHLQRLRRLQSAYIGVLRALHKAYTALLEEKSDEEGSRALIINRSEIEYFIKSEQKKDWTL